MTQALRHRGPDEDGFLVNDSRAPGLALGMRRLSIIDIEGGHQPVWNEAKNVAVVFNGELYNYRELRERLTNSGHRFATHSDTETLVHAWEEWGEECLAELRGMFAFALLDLRGRFATGPLLFLARDPLGIKPLYYTQTPAGFAFASEVRALLACEGVPRNISQDALTSYLLFGSVSEPVTMVEGVFSLPPGHRLLLYVPDRRRMPRPRPWWDPWRSRTTRAPRNPASFDEAPSNSVLSSKTPCGAISLPTFPSGFFFPADSIPAPSRPWRAKRKPASAVLRSLSRNALRRIRSGPGCGNALRNATFGSASRRRRDAIPARRSTESVGSADRGRHQHLFCFVGGARSRPQGGALGNWRGRTVRRLFHICRHAAHSTNHAHVLVRSRIVAPADGASC